MPLLKKRPFEKKQLPETLKDDDEVFHCELTDEIFLDYEEFAERTILCNSMVWTCCMTGRSNLTYQEAVRSEEEARNNLKHFPNELRIPVLFLAAKTSRATFFDMTEDVFSYMKDRYFVGETVEAFSGAKWCEYHIVEVMEPSDDELRKVTKSNGVVTQPPNIYKYDLEQVNAEDDDLIEKMIANFTQIRRKKGIFTRDKCKLFLKQYVDVNQSGVWIVKKSAMEQFGLDRISFDQIFAGPLPKFDNSRKGVKVVNGKQRQATLAKFLKDSVKDTKIDLFADAQRKQEERDQKKQKERDQKKQKIAEEKQKKQKIKEENIKTAKLIQKWQEPKEDLELEDQKKLPELPSIVQSKIPNEYMADMLMILDFVNSFSKILHTKDFFAHGFTYEVIERALTEKQVAGELIDLIQMLLNAIFAQQEEETTHIKISVEDIRPSKPISDTPNILDCIKFATVASKFSTKHQGLRLDKLPMYSLTVTEILRLHLLSSGARINESGARWRYQYRGGYLNEDDPGLYMRMQEPHIIRALEHRNIVELSLKNKIKIISCLMNQLLTYADVRDIVDERVEVKINQKAELKLAQLAEKKRLADMNIAKVRARSGTEEEIKQKLAKIEEENEKQQIEYEKKIKKIKSTPDHVVLLGYDRGFRRYLRIESIPGVFVDSSELNLGTCLTEPIHQVPELVNGDDQTIRSYLNKISEENTSDKENKPHRENGVNGVTIQDETKQANDLFICSGDEVSCSVHASSRMKEPVKFIPSIEVLSELEQALNPRGVRENELKKSLEYYNVSSVIRLTPTDVLTGTKENVRESTKMKKLEDANFGYPLDTDPLLVMKDTLIENILDMEEKLFAGNLGCLKVQDRQKWRACLLERNFNDFDRTILKSNENGRVNGIKEEHESRSSRESTPETRDIFSDPGYTLAKVPIKLDDESPEDTDVEMTGIDKETLECLSIALAQVGLSVESRYLKKPLGSVENKKYEQLPVKPVLENWEKSLLASTSYSQIFLHFGTLDSCILWSKSTLLAWCRVCRKRGDPESMLLCDDCNAGYHFYCLKSKLKGIPPGEWYCAKCQKERKKHQPKVDPEPKIKKRKIFRDEDVDEDVEDDKVGIKRENSQRQEEDNKEQDCYSDSNESGDSELCKTCGSGGELLSCDSCPKSFHIECVEPPLRHMPRGPWSCSNCKSKKKRQYKGELVSIRKEAEDLPLHNVALQDLLSEIIRHRDAWPFVRPVQKTEVPDYYDVITNPMDFGTIKYKLNMGKYTCDEEFMADAVLVFENCNTYNGTDAEVYKCGVRLLKVFRRKSKELGLKLPEEMEDDDEDEEIQQKSKKRRMK